MTEVYSPESLDDLAIAIIGMAGRFPGAKNIDEFWKNLRDGVESICQFSAEELRDEGINPTLLNNPNYVKASGVLSDIDLFDASFFGFNPREAALIDPQQRIFLECAWEALENAGYNPETYPGAIGVYAGLGMSSYWLNNLFTSVDLSDFASSYQVFISNDKDFLSTRVSYKLNLRGPSLNIQTACSTSLVAVHVACRSLLNGECNMALAGGVTIQVPHKTGYLYQEGMILSPDGHCRAFDAQAKGTVGGNGAGIVVLKRLTDAIADGDCIHAIIKGSAINNDGRLKVGYTAPSVEGQAAVISEAQNIAGVEPETITYIESHGTGTPLGDPIEITALTKAFRVSTEKKGFCAIGSVKTNLGHLDAAAGVASLIKTVLSLEHQQIPPSLHFNKPNPKIDFANSPFYVNSQLSEWQRNGIPRRAGVSSFGIGGTNAHVILEEWEPTATRKLKVKSQKSKEVRKQENLSPEPGRKYQLLVLSVQTPSALETATVNLGDRLKQHPELDLADVAYTLSLGRKAFDYRRILVCSDIEDAVNTLTTLDAKQVFTSSQKAKSRPVIFMFSGQGAQYVNMARELYETEAVFRKQIDYCCEILKPHLGFDLQEVLYPSEQGVAAATEQLKQTAITQSALFVIEYSLAQLWMNWGIIPQAAIGHSIGEYVAATLAEVFSLEDALALVVARGKLMQSMPLGSMLAVPLPASEVQPLLAGTSLQVAVINSPKNCVVSGTTEAIEAFEKQLEEKEIEGRRLLTSHAFHSSMMEPILHAFTERVKQVKLHRPKLLFVSNVTGTWIKEEDATNPNYWVTHLRSCVLFADGVKQFFNNPDQILLEVGPGRTLKTLASQHPDKPTEQIVLNSVRHPQEKQSDVAFLLNTLGQLWLAGVEVDWIEFYRHEQRQRVPLPTYPFERQRYWIEPKKQVSPVVKLDKIWQSVTYAVQLQSQKGVAEFETSIYQRKQELFENLSAAYMGKALQELSAFSELTQSYSLEALRQKLHIIPRYQQLLARCLKALVERGQLQEHQGMFSDFQLLSKAAFEELFNKTKAQWEDTPELFQVLENNGKNYRDILIGKTNPLELLFDGPMAEVVGRADKEAPETRYIIRLIQTAVQNLVQSVPNSVRLRILEVGAGRGLTTVSVLPVLPVERTRYTFTDVGPIFLSQAKENFSDYPFMEYRLLDLDAEPNEQGFDPQSFDVIIGSQVLHATRNLSQTLRRVRSLLAPGGILLIWEYTKQIVNFDVITPLLQLIEEDELRTPLTPFLSKDQWRKGLHSYGFSEIEIVPQTDALDQCVIVAQANASTSMPGSKAFVELSAQNTAVNSPEIFLGKKPVIATQKEESSSLHSRLKLATAYVAPRNLTEQTIADIWQKVLGIEQIGIHDNFFDLGGDSLIAVYIVAKLREVLKTNLTANSVIEEPTIAGLAQFIERTTSTQDLLSAEALSTLPSVLVKMQAGSKLKQPLFLIHPGSGSVFFYGDLVRYLGTEQPVYGVQAQGLYGEAEPLTRVEDMADQYIKAIRVIQPSGPYFLGGSSLGGAIAFEMAQRLREQGEPIALLAMIDTPGGSMKNMHPKIELDRDEEILAFLLDMRRNEQNSKEILQHLEPDEQILYFIEHGNARKHIPPKLDVELAQVRHLLHVFRVNAKAAIAYVPTHPYQGQIIYFRALERDVYLPYHPEKGWIDLATEGLEIRNVPGNHETMHYSPHVQVMATKLKAYLEQAQATHFSSDKMSSLSTLQS